MATDVISDLKMAGFAPGATGRELRLTKTHAMINCCFHSGDNDPSLSVSLSGTGYHCFGCNANGSYRQLQSMLLPHMYGSDTSSGTQQVLAEQVKVSQDLARFNSSVLSANNQADSFRRLDRINSMEANSDIMFPWEVEWRGMSAEFLKSVNAKFWISREINNATRDEDGNFEFMDVPRIYFPFKHPRLSTITLGYAARRLDGYQGGEYGHQAKYYNSSLIPTKEILYLHNTIRPRSPIVIVEGPADALKLQYYGIPAIAALGTNQWSEKKTRMIVAKRPSAVIALGDGDEAGWKFNQTLYQIFKPIYADRFFHQDLPENVDPGDFNDEWINFIYSAVNNVSGGYLEQMRSDGQLGITDFTKAIQA